MTTPTAPGIFRFDGIRRTSSRNDIVQVHAIVEVRMAWRGRVKELGVALFGRARIYPLDVFSGEWAALEVEPQR